jgi:hypothetical protein
MTIIYWAGGEDSDLYQVGGAIVSTNSAGFRSGYARCGLLVNGAASAQWIPYVPFSSTTSSFWSTMRVYTGTQGTSNGSKYFSWLDSSGIERLRLVGTGTNSTYRIEKVDSTPTATQLGSNFTMVTSNGAILDKLDVYINYNTSGQITVYLNGIQQFTYSGDVTTNSVTALGQINFGYQLAASSWLSEMIVSDTDTRSMSLQTLAPVANGNTHNFDTGSPAAANVNEIVLNDATLDGSTTAGQIDEYTIPALVSGTFSIIAVGISARMQKGATGPSKMDLVVRSGSTDYLSSDQVLTTTWTGYQNWWVTDPNTSASWTGLPVNIGLKSVT